MARYVDANLAPIYLNKSACKQIKMMPTADVVEVVRCKDCKYFNKDRNECFMHSEEDYIFTPETFDFCSYGERK